jgi:hypothetical protein
MTIGRELLVGAIEQVLQSDINHLEIREQNGREKQRKRTEDPRV